jgi:thiol-disulfide isomerase/thioredoxin
MQDLEGRKISLASLRGKVTVINFWATWCGPCRAEIPDLVALQEKYRDTLQIIGISEDEASPEIVKQFAGAHRVNYPIVMVTPELEKIFPVFRAADVIHPREARVVQHVGCSVVMSPRRKRVLAGLPVNAKVEHVDQTQGLKLENGAQSPASRAWISRSSRWAARSAAETECAAVHLRMRPHDRPLPGR